MNPRSFRPFIRARARTNGRKLGLAATEALNNQGPGPGVYRLCCKYHEGQGMEAFLEAT